MPEATTGSDARRETPQTPAAADPPGGDMVVTARGLTKVYGSGDAAVRALRGIDVAIGRGELTAIMGPSGSGKSTLMHILAGLDRPTAGSVTVDGVEITGLKERDLTQLRRDRIGFIFQSFNLLPMLTARENIVLPLTIASKPVDQSWFDRLIGIVRLEDRLTHKPSELSGGQQQRVAVARSLVGQPAVLFADEPTGNLDSRRGEEVLQLLRHSVDEFGQTIIMVTHDAHAASISDRVLFLKDGVIVHDAGSMASEDIYDVIRSLEGICPANGNGDGDGGLAAELCAAPVTTGDAAGVVDGDGDGEGGAER